jgi:hypothetical protein
VSNAKCPLCGGDLIVDLEVTGGCMGGHGEASFCYCDSQDIIAEACCRTPKCKYQRLYKPSCFSDRYSIARWITEHWSGDDKG